MSEMPRTKLAYFHQNNFDSMSDAGNEMTISADAAAGFYFLP
ncbi:hypothetical protein [Acinetobacter pragensis]|nr:hypothetical protein [Acinetobacter pragensis]